MHKWIARDGYYECTACGLEAEAGPFRDGYYPLTCESYRCKHYVVAVPAGPDEEPHGECYHCSRQF